MASRPGPSRRQAFGFHAAEAFPLPDLAGIYLSAEHVAACSQRAVALASLLAFLRRACVAGPGRATVSYRRWASPLPARPRRLFVRETHGSRRGRAGGVPAASLNSASAPDQDLCVWARARARVAGRQVAELRLSGSISLCLSRLTVTASKSSPASIDG